MTHSEQKIYRFGEAPIWELQRAYYEQQGIRAWQSEEVPQYITSNPMIAIAYAEIIFGFLQDRARLGYTSESEPVTILELGAGSGRLAFHVLKELCELRDYSGIPISPFRYVMSDLAIQNVTYWQQHRSLYPFVEQGVLDFAQFDAVTDTELSLTQSGIRIRRGDLQQPLLIIANYFFDSIPQELIYVDENKIYECMVSLRYPDEAAELSASDRLKSVIPEYHYRHYRRAAEYEQESYPYREIIELYLHKLEDSHVLFPAIGLQCLDRLNLLSREGFVLLTADKGDHRLESWEYNEPPKLILHGSFSLTANYHAIGHVFEQKGAMCLFTSHPYNHLNIGCILMLSEPRSYGNTRLAYRRFVERFGPDDFFSIKEWFDAHLDHMEIHQLLSFWRLGGYDAQIFTQSAKRFSDLLSSCEEEELADIRQGILLMWAGYYPMEVNRDLALDCATLLYQMEMFKDALQFFEQTQNEYKNDVSVLYDMAICYYEIGEEDAAEEFAQKSIRIAPEHEGASALIKLLKEYT
ncbi:Tetratricopeptide repeat-containing protein [Paenibacillus sp. yr247]|uniref:SAM-dependent methyltransferase n=1 Tax=Paenibacillus sp. yr247 TaxID=1761880 RepID=UPI0008920139|nr:SAM-dependent methyltransferase [Paenibacillus sp. yr247]SDN72545.1 Tetratricopeptide repeat-containing protein [Paenibacillus sp. yr247]